MIMFIDLPLFLFRSTSEYTGVNIFSFPVSVQYRQLPLYLSDRFIFPSMLNLFPLKAVLPWQPVNI